VSFLLSPQTFTNEFSHKTAGRRSRENRVMVMEEEEERRKKTQE
jgi:hypothetical protein